jgi:hypothetical protein
MKVPRHKLGGNGHNGNHYPFLSYNEKRKPKLYHDTFILQHTMPEVNFYSMCSPDSSKSKNEDEEPQQKNTPEDELKELHITLPDTSKRTQKNMTKNMQVSQTLSPQESQNNTQDDQLKESKITLPTTSKRTPMHTKKISRFH